ALLCYAAGRIGQSARDMLREASTRAEPEVGHLMLDFANRRFGAKELRRICGLEEIHSKYGPGLVQYGYCHNAPSVDLVSVMIDLAELLQADQYRVAGIQIATSLPPVWLRGAGEPAVKKALQGVRGGASVSAILRPEIHPTYEAQHVLMFVVE